MKTSHLLAILLILTNLFLIYNWESDMKSHMEEAKERATDANGKLDMNKFLDYSDFERPALITTFPVANIAINKNGGELPLWGRIGQSLFWGLLGLFLGRLLVSIGFPKYVHFGNGNE